MADTSSQSAIPANILEQIKSNPTVKQLLGTMIAREAGGEGPEGMKDALQVAIDRAVESGQSLQDVLMTPDAFTSMTFTGLGGNRNVKPLSPQDLQRAYSVIDDPNLKWDLPTTADAFINPALQARYAAMDPKHYKAKPEWLAGKDPVGQYGHHQFYATGYKGGGKPGQPGAAQGVGQTQQGAAGFDPNSLVDPKVQAAVDANLAAEQENFPNIIKSIKEGAEFKAKIGEQLMERISQNDKLNERFNQALDDFTKGMPDEEKLRQEELRKVSDQPMDPTRVFGEMLPMLAVLGGAFTKAGVTGSLNAAAAAMQAAKGNDQDALKRAHEEFADKLQETMDKFSTVHQALTSMIANNRNNATDMIAGAQLLGAQYEVPGLVQAALSGNIRDIVQAADMGTKTLSTLLHINSMMLTNQQKENGKPQMVNDPNTGKSVWAWPEPDGTVRWTDMGGNPIAAPTGAVTHIESGRQIGGLAGYVDAIRQQKQREGGGPVTPDDYIQAARNFTANEASARAFASGPLGNQIQAFNTGIAHLDTLSQLGEALKNSDFPAINGLSQAVAEQTGQEAPTDFDAVVRIVGQEVNKAIVPGAGGEREREAAAAVLSRVKSPEQLAGAIKDIETLMGSQLDSLETRYVGGGGKAADFTANYLTDRSRQLLQSQRPGGFDKDAYVDDVTQARAAIRGGMDPAAARRKLKAEYPNATDQALDIAIDVQHAY